MYIHTIDLLFLFLNETKKQNKKTFFIKKLNNNNIIILLLYYIIFSNYLIWIQLNIIVVVL
jgi:hypothetical protein